MNKRSGSYLLTAFLMFSGVFSPLCIASPVADNRLTSLQKSRLLNLPFGVGESPRALFLRYRHVEAVHFYGGGSKSQFSFQRGRNLFPEGLSLNLKNQGDLSWANGVIRLKQPLDVTKYNSMVLWVRSSHQNLRFWVGMNNNEWKDRERTQARTDIVPIQGFSPDRVAQLVVPFSAVFAETPLDYSRIQQITLEFGQDTVGNNKEGHIEIIGVAFVQQQQSISHLKVVYERMNAQERQLVRKALAEKRAAAPAQEVQNLEPVKGALPANLRSRTATALLEMDDNQTAELFKRYGLEIRSVESSTAASLFARVMASSAPKSEWAAPYSRSWPAEPLEGEIQAEVQPSLWRWLRMLPLWIFPLGFLGAWIWMWLRRRRRSLRSIHALGKVILKIDAKTKKAKDLWKYVVKQKCSYAWFDGPAPINTTWNDKDYFGEAYLKQQIEAGRKVNVKVIPTLSFSKAVFNYETFLSHPNLYKYRIPDPSTSGLSDEALRRMETNAFPLWIPPETRKAHHLPKRILVEYGVTKDFIRFNTQSKELKELAVRVIERLAGHTSGVRISEAADLLRPVPTAAELAARRGDSSADRREFWAEVIKEIKAKHPHFLFIADRGGSQVKALRQCGFDYVENEALRDSVVAHVRAGHVGTMQDTLSSDNVDLLKASVFNLSRLLAAGEATNRIDKSQNLLSAVILSLLPGMVQHSGDAPVDFEKFLLRVSRSFVFRKGKFLMLPTSHQPLMSFARWKGTELAIVVANLSQIEIEGLVRLDPLLEGFNENKLYLMNNMFHGASYLKSLHNNLSQEGPALALWGQNLKESGLPIKMKPLSFNVLTLSLEKPISQKTFKQETIPTLVK